MNLFKKLLIATGLVTLTTAAARESEPLVRDSHRIESIACELKEEFDFHYRHSRGYCELTRDLATIRKKARCIRELARDCYASLGQIREHLHSLDSATDHLHEVLDAIGPAHHRSHTCRLNELLGSLDRTIYRMKATTRELAYHHGSAHRSHLTEPADIIGSIFRHALGH